MGSKRTQKMHSMEVVRYLWAWIIGVMLVTNSQASERVSCVSVGLLQHDKCTCKLLPRARISVDCKYGSLEQYPKLIDPYNWVPITAIDLSHNKLQTYREFDTDVDLINLSNNLIQSIERDGIQSGNLAFLDLSFNHLSSLDRTFSKTQRLVTLIATGNSISEVMDLGFPDTLLHLHLDQNPVERFFESIPTLRHLRISLAAPGAQAKATASQINMAGVPNLEIFEVTDTPLALDPFSRNTLGELRELKVLRYTRCDLAYFGPESEDYFQELADRLDELWLDGNRFQQVPSRALGVFEHLKILNLAGNDISKLHHSDFQDFTHLRELDLSHNLLSDIDRFTFTALEGLEELNLSGNKIHEIPEGTFAHLHHLRKLDLSSNYLQHLRPDSFEPYALQDIRISVAIGLNPFVCDCDLKWVVDNASWDEKANNEALKVDRDTGPFYDALNEMESYRSRHSRRQTRVQKALFPLTWFTQCKAPDKYKNMVMADLLTRKDYHYACENTKL